MGDLNPPKRVVHPTFTTHNIRVPSASLKALDVNGAPVEGDTQFLVLSSDHKSWEWFGDESTADRRASVLNADAREKQAVADDEYNAKRDAWNKANPQ